MVYKVKDICERVVRNDDRCCGDSYYLDFDGGSYRIGCTSGCDTAPGVDVIERRLRNELKIRHAQYTLAKHSNGLKDLG